MNGTRGLFGIFVLCLLAWLMSSNRRRIPWKTVIGGLLLQWILAFVVLRTLWGQAFFDGIASLVTVVLAGADEGAKFVFGPLAGDHASVAWKAIAGIKIMTTIIIVSTLASLGYHYGILQRVVQGMAWVMTRTLGITGAESLSGASNVFLGQTESPLLVRPFLSKMTESELMAVMTGGFATIAVGVMAYYVSLLGVDAKGQPDAARTIEMARHLLTASLMAAPASFVIAKIMVPPRADAAASDDNAFLVKSETMNGIDAATKGASDGMMLAINVLAMLIAFIALVKVIDIGLGAFGNLSFVSPVVAKLGMSSLSMNGILGLIFSPIAWCNGVEGADCRTFGGLLGQAMATNEMIAYGSLSEIIKSGGMSERSIVMATYSLCGFANIGSIGIQIGGIGALAPDRRNDLVRLAPRAMFGGAMATWMTGAIAGMLVH